MATQPGRAAAAHLKSGRALLRRAAAGDPFEAHGAPRRRCRRATHQQGARVRGGFQVQEDGAQQVMGQGLARHGLQRS